MRHRNSISRIVAGSPPIHGWEDVTANAATVTLIKPGVSLQTVERSLKIVLRDIKLRRWMDEEGAE